MPSTRKLRTSIAWFALVLLTTHLFFVVYFAVSHGDVRPSVIRCFYSRIILVGPFFIEERIGISPHLSISFYYNDAWTPPIDYSHKSFLAYHRSPWKLMHLQENDYQRYLARAAYKASQDAVFSRYNRTEAFRRFHAYTMGKLAPHSEIDSIRIVYVFNTFSEPSCTPVIDTVWRLTYNPDDIAAHR
ncbi:MAG TPA: hypothetical protein VD816_02610 [Ohtaekwangia sp.]|nr:hypothetical protein [Ohtaekwangia sp.]